MSWPSHVSQNGACLFCVFLDFGLGASLGQGQGEAQGQGQGQGQGQEEGQRRSAALRLILALALTLALAQTCAESKTNRVFEHDDAKVVYIHIVIDIDTDIEPYLGTNEHLIARMDTILRQVEAPLNSMCSRWVPASSYSVKWSSIACQWSNIKKLRKMVRMRNL